MRSEVLTAVKMPTLVLFCVVTPCGLVGGCVKNKLQILGVNYVQYGSR
jgi:hypothetical protein